MPARVNVFELLLPADIVAPADKLTNKLPLVTVSLTALKLLLASATDIAFDPVNKSTASSIISRPVGTVITGAFGLSVAVVLKENSEVAP